MAKPKILIVDDEPSIRRSIIRALGKEKYFFAEAVSGNEGLILIKSQTFDLVILDIMMPGMDGHEMLQHLMKDATMLPKALMLSSLKDDENRLAGLEEGAVAYMTKPFNPAILRQQAEHLIRLRTLEEQNKAQKQLMLRLLAILQPFLIEVSKGLQASDSTAVRAVLEAEAIGPDALPIVLDVLRGAGKARDGLRTTVQLFDASARYFRLDGHTLALKECQLFELLRDLTNQQQDSIDNEGISIVLEGMPYLVSAEEDLLQRALGILLRRAIARAKPSGTVRMKLSQEKGYAKVRIWDSGPIIPPKVQSRLFEGLDSEGAVTPADLDVELAYARRIAELHGGDLSCESGPDQGRGAAFLLTLDTGKSGLSAMARGW